MGSIPGMMILISILFYSSLSFSSASSIIRLPSDDSNQVCPNDSSSSSSSPGSCPVKCFKLDPVCGDNGVTYWCGCPDALCSGTRVSKRGFCEVGNGGSSSISGQAFLLVHIIWLILLGFSLLCGLL